MEKLKCYRKDTFDNKQVIDTLFYTPDEPTVMEEIVAFPMKIISKLCASETIAGNVLIDASAGCHFFHLIPLCESFSEIILLDASDSSIEGTEAWRKQEEEEPFDWYFTTEFAPELKITRDMWKQKEEILRCKISKVLRVNLCDEHPSDLSSLPKADCVMTMYLLNPASKNYQSFCLNLKSLASLLNPGGMLLWFGAYHGKSYKVGEDTFFLLDITKDQAMEAMKGAGLTVQKHETLKSKICCDNLKCDQLVFVKAIKE
ncbi:nicotinamide N-methyltransferase-like [Gastrophryne carolinensis]